MGHLSGSSVLRTGRSQNSALSVESLSDCFCNTEKLFGGFAGGLSVPESEFYHVVGSRLSGANSFRSMEYCMCILYYYSNGETYKQFFTLIG